ncbi:hypothetical protein M404DRAFT_153181 [Pisolithus tinctorius Marx 270]|uniref:CxC5 like cysteine cluster associated with KDZ domain-containing protein n=1 Tax=Pisolithus tinctorius Marx 270 TaxID=870435 RepID=A0A0C3NZ23_PISTI|nr:hypothetical protein M404DRAFT_153181 [Pisolithus tinctorius Marx 270]
MVKPAIEHHTVDIHHPPGNLPGSVERLLVGLLGTGIDVIQSYWVLLCHVVWQAEVVVPSANDIQQFNRYAYGDIYPPTYVCLSSDCPNYQMGVLTDPITYQATRFTLQYGVLPIYTTSMYFCKCFRRYHHNFSVHKSTNTRTYYYGVPSTIQVATHFFIDTPLLELFANAKVFGWQVMHCFTQKN